MRNGPRIVAVEVVDPALSAAVLENWSPDAGRSARMS